MIVMCESRAMKQQGFSLIEVLITLLLTAIGFLGMVAMQVKSFEYQQETVDQNTAVELANELIEVFRAHRDELYVNQPPEFYGYSRLKTGADSPFYAQNGSPKFNSSSCDRATAVGQAGCVLKKIEERLMGGKVTRVCPSFADNYGCAGVGYQGSTLVVRLEWETRAECPENENTHNNACTYTVRVEL